MPPRGVKPGTKRARQYERIKESEQDQGASERHAEEIAAFMVFSNATLEEIATRRPRTPRALLAVSGVSEEHLRRLGTSLADLS